jgi:thiamine kinase-like enzyme
MTLTLEEAIARVPMWQSAKDLKTTPLGGGITNHNYRVDVDGESFVLRIIGAKTDMLGIDRQDEYRANLEAGRLGIAPEVIYFIQPEGYLVTRFISARPIPPEEIRKPENTQAVASMLQRIHKMPPITGTFDAFRIVESYTEIARRFQVTFPANFDWLISELHQAEKALLRNPYQPAVCHNDLLNENFLLQGDRIFLLDWEYAGMGDIYFDLANFSVNHGLSDEQDRWLLDCYFGQVSQSHWARLKVMKIMSDFREAMWGMVQIGISELDFDFRGYADKHFSRLTNNIQNPLWGKWLKEI